MKLRFGIILGLLSVLPLNALASIGQNASGSMRGTGKSDCETRRKELAAARTERAQTTRSAPAISRSINSSSVVR